MISELTVRGVALQSVKPVYVLREAVSIVFSQ